MRIGDLVRFRYRWNKQREGVFLVTHLDGTWVSIYPDPDARDGEQLFHQRHMLEVLK